MFIGKLSLKKKSGKCTKIKGTFYFIFSKEVFFSPIFKKNMYFYFYVRLTFIIRRRKICSSEYTTERILKWNLSSLFYLQYECNISLPKKETCIIILKTCVDIHSICRLFMFNNFKILLNLKFCNLKPQSCTYMVWNNVDLLKDIYFSA